MTQASDTILRQLASAVEDGDRARVLGFARNLRGAMPAGLDAAQIAQLRRALSGLLAEYDARAEAEAAHVEALREMSANGARPEDVLQHIEDLAGFAEARGDLVAADHLVTLAIQLIRDALGDDHADLPALLERLADLKERQGLAGEARHVRARSARMRIGAQDAGSRKSADPPEALSLPGAPVPEAMSDFRPEALAKADAEEAAVDLEVCGAATRKVDVFFVTHRRPTGQINPYRAFDGLRNGEVSPVASYGVAEVSVPLRRPAGSLPTAGWLDRHAGFASDELFLLKRVDTHEKGDWLGLLRAQVARGGGREALLYVHGFNIDFWEAMVRAAQLHHDLGIEGAVATYSWPSRGNVLSYLQDRLQIIQPHIDELRSLITNLIEESGAERVTIIAHSMGCEFMLRALADLRQSLDGRSEGAGKAVIGDVIFAAPDVDMAQFAGLVPRLAPLAERVSVYCSGVDNALSWGQLLFTSYDRAGMNAQKLAAHLNDSADTIDTTQVMADVLGHTDYASSALDDLRARIWLSLMPPQRPTLEKRVISDAAAFWVYRPDMGPGAEGGAAFREAVALARSEGGVAGALALVRSRLGSQAQLVGNAGASGVADREVLRVLEAMQGAAA